MKSGSLIFLAIVAIWAVFLLQQWVHRRENLATARSVDRYSESMRILERRGVALAEAGERPSLRAGVVTAAGATPLSEVDDDPAHDRPADETGGSVLSGLLDDVRVKAAALGVVALLFVVTVALTPFGKAPWWSPLLALAAMAGVVAWLRSGAVQRARSAAAQRRLERSTRPARSARPRPARGAVEPVAVHEPAVRAHDHELDLPELDLPEPAAEQTPSAPAEQTGETPARPERDEAVYDLLAEMEQDEAEHRRPAAAATREPVPARAERAAPAAGPGSWAPVEVPPPTYTMKARADRPQPAPAEAEPAPRSYADVPNDELPFDGLALDQDVDDLPDTFRAG